MRKITKMRMTRMKNDNNQFFFSNKIFFKKQCRSNREKQLLKDKTFLGLNVERTFFSKKKKKKYSSQPFRPFWSNSPFHRVKMP